STKPTPPTCPLKPCSAFVATSAKEVRKRKPFLIYSVYTQEKKERKIPIGKRQISADFQVIVYNTSHEDTRG
ncbi:MAG: hypothetical protein UV63_C0027G0016, partial [Microgenomates group bacterium GW2011_GWC1_43_11]